MKDKLELLVYGSLDEPMIKQFINCLNEDDVVRASINLHVSSESNISRELLSRIEIVCNGLPSGWTESMPSLKWIYFLGAGIEAALTPDLVGSNVIITNASGVHAVPISEHILGMMFMFARKLHLCMRRQVQCEWNRSGFEGSVGELYGSTLGVIGLGDIGEALAQRAKCLGMKVVATRRHPERTSPFADRLLPSSELDTLLKQSDYIAVCAPLTNETRGLIGEAQFSLMKQNAVIINIARGAVIDQDAMIEALRMGRIAGAGLDVTTPEPLPSDSPLWSMPNVIISPHVSGLNPHYGERAAEIFIRNLGFYLKGDYQHMPTLVDRKAGY
ncbi:MAG: D-2-hydroxyacid dehydrogenase [Armatimonadota bacterium]